MTPEEYKPKLTALISHFRRRKASMISRDAVLSDAQLVDALEEFDQRLEALEALAENLGRQFDTYRSATE